MKHAAFTLAGVLGGWMASGVVVSATGVDKRSPYLELVVRAVVITGGVLVAHRIEGRR